LIGPVGKFFQEIYSIVHIFLFHLPGEKVKIVIAASYLNFLIANEVVLVPKYWKKGRDEEYKKKDETVQKIFEHAFPNRKIVRITPENVTAGGGGIHGISKQMPKSTKRR